VLWWCLWIPKSIGVFNEAISPFFAPLCRIQVASDQEKEARSILERSKQLEAEGHEGE
jgi:hypothetical protein